MKVMGIDEATQMDILKVVAAILHMGNITFREDGNKGVIQDLNCKFNFVFLNYFYLVYLNYLSLSLSNIY